MLLRRKLALITIVYWILLLYIIAALVWWFIALNRQNDEMMRLRISQVAENSPAYRQAVTQAEAFKKRKVAQYIGEGATFLLLIVVGAVFVYRATRKQLQLGQQQRNFMMAVTHELKTPIAVTKLNVETLKKRKLDEGQQQQLLQSTLMEADRLNDLTNNILLASRLDGGQQEQHADEIDLVQMTEQVLNQYELRYPNRSFLIEHSGEGLLEGDKLLLKILLSNLIDNAVKYTPANKPVTIKIDQNDKTLRLQVIDEGEGIPVIERKKVFEKFYRMGNEATRSAKGTGLGLYLCQRIVKEHKGTIQIEDNQPSGAIFTLTFQAS